MIPFEGQIAQMLRGAQISFETERAVGGLRPDFVVPAPDGRVFVIEAKAWGKTPGFTKRAANQARLFQQEVGADEVFMVLEGLEKSRPSLRVFSSDNLIAQLRKELNIWDPPDPNRPPLLYHPAKRVFAAMPFAAQYDDVFFVAMRGAAKAVGAVCERVNQEKFVGDIVQKIREMIRESVAVIADLSESRPNVLYETGFAHALEKPTIHICSTPLEELPFDVSHWNTIEYRKGQTLKLLPILKKLLQPMIL